MIGRESQMAQFKEAFQSNKPSFVAITGRRRVGKTYLVREACGNNMCFYVTGIQNADIQTQVNNFMQKLQEYAGKSMYYNKVFNWQDAFVLLKQYLQQLPKNKKQVLFFDELPWMATAKSGFIQLLAHLWNDYLSKEKHFILVICGSSTSWITQKILNDRGGFHNRVTLPMHLEPFTLAETKRFLDNKRIKFTPSGIAEIYMTLGGLPYYLEQIKAGESPQQAIGRLCFHKNGLLKNEYQNLYKALFTYWENHEAIVSALSKSKAGLLREDLIKKSKVKSGGPFSRAMEELILSGFVIESSPFGKVKRGKMYRMADEFSVFYHRFMKGNEKKGIRVWEQIYASQSYKVWRGFAFESLCLKHAEEIKIALGIHGIYSEVCSFNFQNDGEKQGVQIDLLIDRKDATINLCECKFHESRFEITKKYAQELKERRSNFRQITKSKKMIFNTFIANEMPKSNSYFFEAVDNFVLLDELM